MLALDPITALIRSLAAALSPHRSLAEAAGSDSRAVQLFMTVAHGGRCPRCGGAEWKADGAHHIVCGGCKRLSVYKGTPWARRRVGVRVTLAAIFGIFVDSATPSARGFARNERLRLETAWKLLHMVRAALPPPPCPEVAMRFPLLGGDADDNRADVVVGVVDGVVTALKAVVDPDFAVGPREPAPYAVVGPAREVPAVWGQLRAWLTATFRGVSARHLDGYLAEFVARAGRVEARSPLYRALPLAA